MTIPKLNESAESLLDTINAKSTPFGHEIKNADLNLLFDPKILIKT
jgi:hypothetical protein